MEFECAGRDGAGGGGGGSGGEGGGGGRGGGGGDGGYVAVDLCFNNTDGLANSYVLAKFIDKCPAMVRMVGSEPSGIQSGGI